MVTMLHFDSFNNEPPEKSCSGDEYIASKNELRKYNYQVS